MTVTTLYFFRLLYNLCTTFSSPLSSEPRSGVTYQQVVNSRYSSRVSPLRCVPSYYRAKSSAFFPGRTGVELNICSAAGRYFCSRLWKSPSMYRWLGLQPVCSSFVKPAAHHLMKKWNCCLRRFNNKLATPVPS